MAREEQHHDNKPEQGVDRRRQLVDSIKERIKASGKSQGALAREIGVSRTWLSNWLNKETTLSVEHINALCDVLSAESALRQALLKEFHPNTAGEPLRKDVEDQQRAEEVWVVAPHLRLSDDLVLLEQVIKNVAEHGVRYIFWSANNGSLLGAARTIEEKLRNARRNAEVRFVAGPRWLNLSAWRIVDPHKEVRRVARLAVDEFELRLKAGQEGSVVHGALAHEVCEIFATALVQLTNGQDSLFSTVRIIPAKDTQGAD